MLDNTMITLDLTEVDATLPQEVILTSDGDGTLTINTSGQVDGSTIAGDM